MLSDFRVLEDGSVELHERLDKVGCMNRNRLELEQGAV